MENTLKAIQRIIDTVWTLDFEIINEKEVKIKSLCNQNPEGYKAEKQLPSFSLIEGAGRVVEGVRIAQVGDGAAFANGTHHKVSNPQFIFSYS